MYIIRVYGHSTGNAINIADTLVCSISMLNWKELIDYSQERNYSYSPEISCPFSSCWTQYHKGTLPYDMYNVHILLCV